MPPKRAARRREEDEARLDDPSSSSPSTGTTAVGASAPSAASPALSTLSMKACVTCGRLISPRAKWAKKWAEIKTCSDACKALKVGSRANIVSVQAHQVRRSEAARNKDGTVEATMDQKINDILQVMLVIQDAKEEATVNVDVDAWIELALLRCAASPSTTSSPLPTTDDVEAGLNRVAKVIDGVEQDRNSATTEGTDLSEQNGGSAAPVHISPRSLSKILQSGPGLRERVRRAARRLFVLEHGLWACAATLSSLRSSANEVEVNLKGTEIGLDLLQGGKVLKGLEGVSFAKGTIGLKRRRTG